MEYINRFNELNCICQYIENLESFEILKAAGILIRDFEWENDTDQYLRFISECKWRNKDEFLVKFEEELNQYPISCLKNIVHVEGTTADAIAKMQKYAKENLTRSCHDETDWQLQNKIAYGLSLYSSIPHCLIALRDSDLSDQQRNEVWKKIIDRWRKRPSENQASIDINNFRDALKERDQSERKNGSKNALLFDRKPRQ